MTRWLACVSCTLAIENEALARGNRLSSSRVASFIRGDGFIGNGRGTNRPVSVSFFFFTIASCTNAHDTRFPIDRHESLITRRRMLLCLRGIARSITIANFIVLYLQWLFCWLVYWPCVAIVGRSCYLSCTLCGCCNS